MEILEFKTPNNPYEKAVADLFCKALTHHDGKKTPIAGAYVVVYSDGSFGTSYEEGDSYPTLLGGITDLQHRLLNRD